MYLVYASKDARTSAQELVQSMRLQGASIEFAKNRLDFIVKLVQLRPKLVHLFGIKRTLSARTVKLLSPKTTVVITLSDQINTAQSNRLAESSFVDQSISTKRNQAESALFMPAWLTQYHPANNGVILDRRGLVAGQYLLAEKGARISHVAYDLPIVRLNGRETRQERDTLYGSAKAVFAAKNEKMSIGYGKVPIIQMTKLHYADVAFVVPGEALPQDDDLVAMGYFNRSLCTDYLSVHVHVRQLLSLYQRIEFFGQTIQDTKIV